MSLLSALGVRDERDKTVMAEVPVIVQSSSSREGKHKSPQEKLDRFWKKFTTEAPGKATAVIPQNKTISKAARGETNVVSSTGTTTTRSYEEAAKLCKGKVEKIVRECRRINQKYRDPHFDLEFDLKTNRRDCLVGLDNTVRVRVVIDSGSDASLGPRKRHRRRIEPSRGHTQRRSRGHTGPLVDVADSEGDDIIHRVKRDKLKDDGGDQKAMPKVSRDGPDLFRPCAVKRVGEIFDSPTFYIDGPTANDVRQGREAGDCWLMAALCTLSNKPGLIERICVARDEAVGVYGFVFHRDGEWISEIIDDKLYLTKPDYDESRTERIMWEDRDRVNSEETYRKTYQANSGALYFAQCEDGNETWLPLLEKAYAKAHGDYAAIEGGFTGEGIEDLTGGVTSELFSTDVLDKEYFWKEELMKVNEQFLFGCSTGVWGRVWGERKGIMEQHAYSVMRAVEMDGERLVLLKNPWGKGEWSGAWSDGSNKWTPEWLQKLNYRFGDDGAFWISYEDLLRKYQAFDRTRLFGEDWAVASIWTTLSVPWTLEYHDTKFAFTLKRRGPVVLVLSQLDDRYFRGLEGQYRFELSFRLHLAGEEDYVVRSQTTYRMIRSVNVELELEAGEYHVLVRIDATRDSMIIPAEDVVKANAKENREKLIRIGLAYDVAHSKGNIVETPEERVAREGYEKWKRDKEKNVLREKIMKEQARSHYVQVKRREKDRKDMGRRRAKQKAREEKMAAAEEERRKAEERLTAERVPPPPAPPSIGMDGPIVGLTERPCPSKAGEDEGEPQDETTNEKKGDAQVQTEESPGPLKDAVTALEKPDGTAPQAEDHVRFEEAKEDSVKDGGSSVGRAENTPTSTASEKSVEPNVNSDAAVPGAADGKSTESTATEKLSRSAVTGGTQNSKGKQSEYTPEPASSESTGQTKSSDPETTPKQDTTATTSPPLLGHLTEEDSFHSARQDPHGSSAASIYRSDSETGNDNHNRPHNLVTQPDGPPHTGHGSLPFRHPNPSQMPPPGYRHQPYQQPPDFHPRRDMPLPMRPGSPPTPPLGGFLSEASLSDVSDPSDISDRELEFHLEDQKKSSGPLPPPPAGRRYGSDSEFDEVERDPWNAVAVVGFRVYYKVGGEEGEGDGGQETVKIRVVRPVWAPVDEEGKDGEEGKKKVVTEGKVKETGVDESLVLDLDDSAKDATLQGGERELIERKEDGEPISHLPTVISVDVS